VSLRLLATGTSLALFSLGTSAWAGTVEYVVNGDFETNTGNGQLTYNTSASGWSVGTGSGTQGYAFLFNAAPNTTSGTSADNAGAVGQAGTAKLWGPGTGSDNGLSLSPNGGAFIGSDPGYPGNQPIWQTLTNLQVGKPLTVTFEWAGAQQYSFYGDQTEGWTVSLGSESYDVGPVPNASQGFTGWMSQSFTFTPTSSTEVLSFLATGTPDISLPPFALLDSVSATQTVPEPATWVLMTLGVAGLGYCGFRSNRRARVETV